MLKKLLLVAVVVGLVGVGVRKTKVFGYAKNEVSSIQEWADEQIPVEDKIKQMRRDVAGLDRDAERVRDELAKTIVEVREFTAQVGSFRAQLETEKKDLLARGEELKSATEKVSIGRLVVPVPEAKEMLHRDVNVHQKRKNQLKSMEDTLASRERTRETLAKQLDGMQKQKLDLTAQIDAVEAEYKTLQLAQIESKYQSDNTQLSKVKESLADMQRKLNIEKERLNLAPKVYEIGGPVGTEQSVDAILAPLNGKSAAKETKDIGKTE